jgi:hypothetical protein
LTQLSQNFEEQKEQMEALAAAVDSLIDISAPLTYRSATHPNQVVLESWWTGLGNTLPIPPQQEIYWHDTFTLRSLHSTMKDYFVPVHSVRPYKLTSGAAVAKTESAIFAIDKSHFIFVGAVTDNEVLTSTHSSLNLRLDGSATALLGSGNAIRDYDPINREALYMQVDGGGEILNFYRLNIDTLVSEDLALDYSIAAAGPPYTLTPVHQMPDRSVLFVNSSGSLAIRAPGGSVTSLVSLAGLSADTLYRIAYDATSDKILLFFVAVSGNTSVIRVNVDGTSPTTLVASAAYAAGMAENVEILMATYFAYRHFGAEVRDGNLYVPMSGLTALNLNRRRVIDIATGVETDIETFDFGVAAGHLEKAVAQATALRELDRIETLDASIVGVAAASLNTGNHRTQASRYWGVDRYSGLFTKLIDIQRLPDDDGWLVKYWNTWGPGPVIGGGGHTLGNYWSTGVLPDDGSSGKVYPVTEYGDGRGDYVVLASYTAEATTKEVVFDWSGQDLSDFEYIEVSLDSGLSGTDTISVQLNGVTSSVYSEVYWRLVNVTNTYTATGGTAIILPSIAAGAISGGRYKLRDKRTFDTTHMQIEGFLSSGITTTLTSSLIGAVDVNIVGEWTSVRIFVTGGVQSFLAGSQFEVTAYRSKSRRRQGADYYGPYVV